MARLPPPSFRFLFAHPAHFVACGLGSGLSPVAPGTVGTLFAWASYPWLRHIYPDDANFALFLVFMLLFGIWCIQVAGRHLGVTDHGAIVWDEIVPFWALLMFVPAALVESPHGVLLSANGLIWQAGAFVLFRLFDILKPPPASFFDQRVKNGFGVMMDDVVAAAYAALCLALVRLLLERWA
jgi:phosphatidylglycerophosphatase A